MRPQVSAFAARIAWGGACLFPVAVWEDLNPRNWNQPGVLAGFSGELDREAHSPAETAPNQPPRSLWRLLLLQLGELNLMVFCFNLLPIPPLDGFWVSRLSLEMILRRDLPDRYFTVLTLLGVILVAFLLLGMAVSMVSDLFRMAFS